MIEVQYFKLYFNCFCYIFLFSIIFSLSYTSCEILRQILITSIASTPPHQYHLTTTHKNISHAHQ